MKNIAKKALMTAAFALTATSGVQATQADILAALDADAGATGVFSRATNLLNENGNDASSSSKSQLGVFQAQAVDTNNDGFRTWSEASVQLLQRIRSAFNPAGITVATNINDIVDAEITALNSLIGGTVVAPNTSTTDRIASLVNELGTDAAAQLAFTRLGGTPAAPAAPLAAANNQNRIAQAEIAATAGNRVFNALLEAAPAAPNPAAVNYDPSISQALRESLRLLYKRYTTALGAAGAATVDTVAGGAANIDDNGAVAKAQAFLNTLRGGAANAPTAENITLLEVILLAYHMNHR